MQTTLSCESDSSFFTSQFIYFYCITMVFFPIKNISAHKILRNIMNAAVKNMY